MVFGALKNGCIVSIGIMSVDLSEFPKITLEDYYNLSVMQLMGFHELVDEDNTTIGGLPAKTLTYTATGEGYAFTTSMAVFLREDVAYLITYLTESECHVDHVDHFELVISRFKF